MAEADGKISASSARVGIMAQMDVAGGQIQGTRKRQEDAFLSLALGGACLLAVSDGMGGHPCGDDASRITIQTLRHVVERGWVRGMSTADSQALLKTAMREAHEAVQKYVKVMPCCERLAATLIAVLVLPDYFVFVSAGDSLLYRLDTEGVLSLLNIRHVNAEGRLLSGIGFRMPEHNSEAVHWHSGTTTLLLASDGLDTLSEKAIAKLLRMKIGAKDAVQHLLTAVDLAGVQGQDNATAVVARFPTRAAKAV